MGGGALLGNKKGAHALMHASATEGAWPSCQPRVDTRSCHGCSLQRAVPQYLGRVRGCHPLRRPACIALLLAL